MFHVRRLVTQANLGILNNLRYNTVNRYLSSSNNKITDLEQIIRIDHTETEEQKEIKLSENCIKRLKELGDIQKYLRITVDSGGCSGFEYKFSLDTLTDEDKVIEKDNCKVIVDLETEEFIKGATIDYHEELIRSGFRIINNPNSEQGCSCGASFSPKI